jgi:BirA family biotin operon repressor/biotin-[acetyl-CoA-carboxylase] ligase
MDSSRLGQRASLALAGTRFARVEWVAETGSTNADLLARAAAAEAEGAVRATEHQSAGRGTKGRTWVDRPGAQLMVSVLLRPDLPPSKLGRLTMAWSVAAADACREVAGVGARLKWPNDVYDPGGECKVAGVLAESQLGPGGRPEAVVIGMGMNVNGGVPEGLGVAGVSLDELAGGGGPIDRVALLVALLRRFDELYPRAVEPEVLDLYRERSATLGRRVRLELRDASLVGTGVDVTDDGHLVVEVDGRRTAYAAADVVHLRPADDEGEPPSR